VPDFDVKLELNTGIKVTSGGIHPLGPPLGVGTADGRLHLFNPPLVTAGPLWVCPREGQYVPPPSGLVGRLLSKPQPQRVWQCPCPTCRSLFPVPPGTPEALCPTCQRPLRLTGFTVPW
jgi:hypothetical protein